MNKKLLLLIPVIASLIACNPNNPSSSSKEDESSEETFITETGESEETTETTEEETTTEESSEEAEALFASIGFDDVPAPVNGNEYPAESDITVESGATFHIDGVMQNTGKFKPTNTIQFRSIKKGSAGYIYNNIPLKGQLTITIMKNYVEYNQTDMSGELTVAVSSGESEDTAILQCTKTEEDGKYIFVYEKTEMHYYRIINNSDYAVYATSLVWSE